MPGLLQIPEGEGFTSKLLFAFFAEFLGTAIFALYGSSVTLTGVVNSNLENAVGNGMTLTVVVFITANISGAHLNPAVTIAALITGYTSLIKAVAYIACQLTGGIVGSLLLAGLVKPSVSIGNSALPSGCFGTSDISKGQLFGWEAITTFVLVMTVFAVAISEPHFGIVAPIGVGLSLVVAVTAAGKFTGVALAGFWCLMIGFPGGALNPARALGPSVVFQCNWRTTWVYILGELAGGLVAGLINLPLYGKGTHFLKAATDVVPPSPSDGVPETAPKPNFSHQTEQSMRELPAAVNVTHSSLETPGNRRMHTAERDLV